MILRFKNKWTMQIINLIERGKTLGGLPSRLDISVEEAVQLINEINSLRSQPDTQHSRYKFLQGDVDARLAFTGRELSTEEKFNLLTDWTSGKLSVTFDGVPIQILVEIDEKEHRNFVMG